MADAGGVDLDIVYEEERWRAVLPDIEDRCRQAAAAALRRAWTGPVETEASLMLANDAYLRRLNRDYRGQDTPTNVLSFPLHALRPGEPPAARRSGPVDAGPPLHLGDVAIAYETTRDEAERDGKPLADHLCHLVVHGILHLMGYDHQTDADARCMEALETDVLADLGVADPYDDHDI